MMRKIHRFISFILFVACLLPDFYLFGQLDKTALPHIPLKYLTIQDINQRFDEANTQFKYAEIIAYTAEICKELNGSVLIAKDSTIIVHQQVGFLRLLQHNGNTSSENLLKDSHNAITTSTLFEAASLTKQFTAAAILKLVEQHKLNLTDHLQSFFPTLPYANVTLHHLLTHTSGLPEYIDFKINIFKDTNRLWSNHEIIELLASRKPKMESLPGCKFSYVNTNYLLLASIVEKVSGVPFETFVSEYLFSPAGMEHSHFRTKLQVVELQDIAKGHLGNRKPLPLYFLDETIGDKGLYTNVFDLYQWGQHLFTGHILPDSLLQKMTIKQNVTTELSVNNEIYGYGYRIEESAHYGKLIFHGGLWRGFQNLFIYRPSDHFYIIFLSNFRNKAHFRKSDEYFHLLDGV